MLSKISTALFVVNYFLFAAGHPSDKFFRDDYQYIRNMNAFYKIHSKPSTWFEAKDKCESEGTSLFYPSDEHEVDAVINFWKERASFGVVFIGISAPDISQKYKTLDGKSLSKVFNKWAPGEPNNAGGQEVCINLFISGRINDDSCFKQFPFICKKTLQSLEWNEPCDTPVLGYNYSEILGSCYKFQLQPKTWTDAFIHCQDEQSHLAIINSQDEADYLVDLTSRAAKEEVEGVFLRGAVHLGFQEKNGYWQSIMKGTPLSEVGYLKWGVRQPDSNGQDKCGSMFYNGKLNDIDCNQKMFFICEIDLSNENELDNY